MVLNNINSLPQGSGYCQCGTVPRCSICMYKLICPKSPFCCISGGNCDLSPVLSAISQLNSLITSNSSNINSAISNLQTDISSIGATLNTMNDSINSIGSVVNEILSRLPATTDASAMSINSADTNNAVLMSESAVSNQKSLDNSNEQITPMTAEFVEPNSLATYSPKDSETVFVQKKGLFGKTKWVEEKKK